MPSVWPNGLRVCRRPGRALCVGGAAAALMAGILGGGPAAAQSQTPPIGVVDHVTGRWQRVQDQQFQDRKSLFRGDLLYKGETVTIGSATAGSLEIAFFAGGQRWEKACSEQDPCSGSYRPAPAATAERDFWSFLSSFWERGRQLPPVLTAARGMMERGPGHALIQAEGPDADLRPALENLPVGSYSIRLTPAPESSLDGTGTVHRLSIARDEGPVSVAGLPHGLYVVSVTDDAGQAVGSNALVLLRSRDDTRAKGVWDEVRQVTDGWSRLDPATRSAILAQALYALDVGGH